MEIIARLAKALYKDKGRCGSIHESIKLLLEEHIFKFGCNNQPCKWQEFRDKKLWTLDVNDVFLANLDLIRTIYKTYWTNLRSFMNMADALKFMMHDSHLQMQEKDSIYCYGMCKMSVNNEVENHKQYFILKFVEFIELIGRIAEFKFMSTAMNSIPLYQKIEYILDEIIPYILPGKERKLPEIVELDHSDSDDDY